MLLWCCHILHKDGHISATFISHAIEVSSYSKLVFIAISIKGWTEESYWLFIHIALATLTNLCYCINQNCFPSIDPGGRLWLRSDNKTQIITHHFHYAFSLKISITVSMWLTKAIVVTSLVTVYSKARLIQCWCNAYTLLTKCIAQIISTTHIIHFCHLRLWKSY